MTEQMYQYLELVKTYQLGKWLHTSYKLNPYVLASRGFKCISSDLIECHLCQIHVNFEIMKIGEDNIEQQIELVEKIKIHKKDCMYAKQNLDDQQLYRLSRSQLYSNMDKIFDKMKETFNFYKSGYLWISEDIWNKYLLKYQSVFKKFNDRFSEDKEVHLSQVLPIFGWTILHDNQQQTEPKMICQFCGRVVYVNKYTHYPSEKQKLSGAMITRSNEAKAFNPIQQHRYFCFWGNYDQQRIINESNIYGWEICLKHFQDKMIQVDKGWGRRQKFEEVAKVKQQFTKILDNFSNKTRDIINKFNLTIKQNKPTLLQQQQQTKYEKKINASKYTIESIMNEVEEIIKKPIKKIKLV